MPLMKRNIDFMYTESFTLLIHWNLVIFNGTPSIFWIFKFYMWGTIISIFNFYTGYLIHRKMSVIFSKIFVNFHFMYRKYLYKLKNF